MDDICILHKVPLLNPIPTKPEQKEVNMERFIRYQSQDK